MIFALVYLFVYLVFDVYFVVIKDEGNRSTEFLISHQTLYISLTAIYTVVMIMLNRAMKQFEGNFNNEMKSINGQFLVFLSSYLSRCILAIPREIKALKDLLG